MKPNTSFVTIFVALILWSIGASSGMADTPFRVGTFEVDASPPIGSMMAYDIVKGVQTPLTCRGVVLLTDEAPIVLCSIDWLGVSNQGMQVFRERLASAARTTTDRVAIHAIHQHDAPACDFAIEALLRQYKGDNVPFDEPSARQTMERAAFGVTQAIQRATRVTHIGTSKAVVHQVASNRRVMGPDGNVQHIRWSATKDPIVQAFPEGIIDPELQMISFWNEAVPVAVLTYYATHPQSYYRTGLANPDFPGLARNQAQEAIGVPHIHFNGAGGNITAGKYNDGAPEKRQILADRLKGAMIRAWMSTAKAPIDAGGVRWRVEPVLLPPSEALLGDGSDESRAAIEERLKEQLKNPDLPMPTKYMIGNKLLFLRRFAAKETIDIGCLTLGQVRILHMPGELFVEYQLGAQALRPDLMVAMAAYGEYSPWYIGTAMSYGQGGYEATPDASMVGPSSEPILMRAIAKLLDADPHRIVPLGSTSNESTGGPIRIGIIGCDTSHVPAFADAFHDPNASGAVAGFRVVAAFPGGSPDIPSSIDRVPMYTEHLRKMGVEIVDSVDALVSKVDVVLLESLDGRKHLEQAKPVIAAGKRMFIDKPVAGSLADAIEIYRLSREHAVPIFSSSSLRFSPGIIGMRNDPRTGRVMGCNAYGPCSLEAHHPDLYWYGVHGVEVLYTLMGPGCQQVSRVHTDEGDLVVGVWPGGRIGTFRGIRAGAAGYGATVFGEKGIAPCGEYVGYGPLVTEIATFFRTGTPPVSPEETIEMFAWMEAADESKRQNGASVSLESTLQRVSK